MTDPGMAKRQLKKELRMITGTNQSETAELLKASIGILGPVWERECETREINIKAELRSDPNSTSKLSGKEIQA